MNPIRKIRTEAGLSQAKFAQMLNVHQTAVSQWEQGRTTPDVEVAKKISELFNVSLDLILDNPYVEKQKTPTDSGERSVSDDDIMFALWGDTTDMDEDDLDDVKRYAAFVRERKKKK